MWQKTKIGGSTSGVVGIIYDVIKTKSLPCLAAEEPDFSSPGGDQKQS